MNEIIVLLLAAVPGIEAMWSSAYLICAGQYSLIPAAILVNFLAVVAFVYIVDRFSIPGKVEGFLQKRAERKVKKFEKWFGKYGYAVLFVLIGLPLSGVGSYTGAFIGRVLKLNKGAFYLALFFGISFSVIFAYLIAFGVDLIGIKC